MTALGQVTSVTNIEANIGNPATDGDVLSSTISGVRSWITPKYNRTTTITSSTTPTPNGDTTDIYSITALAVGVTIGAPTGTPTNGQKLIFRIKDNGIARTLAWNIIYRAGDVALPTTTVISKTMYVGFIYNSNDLKWDMVAYLDNL